MKAEKEKNLLLEQLRKIPIIQIACDKAGVGRATFYRWKNDDKDFSKAVGIAMNEGKLFINDLSESQVISLVRDKNWQAIAFWLKHHHPDYADRIELMARVQYSEESLTTEQETIIKKALKLASIITQPEINHEKLKIKSKYKLRNTKENNQGS